MSRSRLSTWIRFATALGVASFIGCDGPTPVPAPTPPDGNGDHGDVSGNLPPELKILEPNDSFSIAEGESFIVRWSDSDRDSAANISLVLVNVESSSELPLAANIPENDNVAPDEFTVHTVLFPIGSYYIRAIISDGVNTTMTWAQGNDGMRLVLTLLEANGVESCVDFDLLTAETSPPSVVKLYFQLSTCSGQPLVGIQPHEFLIEEDGDEVSFYESDQGYVPEPRPFELAAVLLLDMSGSILESGNLPPLQQAAKAFVQTVARDRSTAIYTFDGRAELQFLTGFTQDVNALKSAIDSLSTYQVVDESTNLNGAVLKGLDVLDDEQDSLTSDALFAGALVVFTDGTDQAARVSDSQAVSAANASSHAVYTIGLGGEVDSDHLDSIGRAGSYIASDVSALETVFVDAASDIDSMAHSYYVLAYCSPKRAGDHTLELSLRAYDGSLRFDFDADGFEGGCSSDDFLGEHGDDSGDDDGENDV